MRQLGDIVKVANPVTFLKWGDSKQRSGEFGTCL